MGLSRRDQLKILLSAKTDEERAQWLATHSKSDRYKWLEDPFAYEYILRPEQLAPVEEKDWLYWLLLAGRGFGKTMTGVHWAAHKIKTSPPGTQGCIISVNKMTAGRDILKSQHGLLTSFASQLPRIQYQNKLSGEYEFENGVKVYVLTCESPEAIRGASYSWALVDELFAYPDPEYVFFSCLDPAMRGDETPQVLICTTPPTKGKHVNLVKRLRQLPDMRETRGTSFDNRALPKKFRKARNKDYYTRTERIELFAEILDEGGAVFNPGKIQRAKIDPRELDRVVIGVDPASGSGTTGISVCGIKRIYDKNLGKDISHGYVLADLSIKGTPLVWAKRAIDAYHKYSASCIVAESNQGGQMVEATLRQVDHNANIKLVSAQQSKGARAETVAALYEQGRVFHCEIFQALEDQMLDFDPATINKHNSPDRVDAMVWALRELMLTERGKIAPLNQFTGLAWL